MPFELFYSIKNVIYRFVCAIYYFDAIFPSKALPYLNIGFSIHFVTITAKARDRTKCITHALGDIY
ncbi:MAG: hypothetical protein BHV89_01990 [Clostridiales bacterium 41_21_two_genomes]|nr:MAG: hypothetical protein BHV89_01990 [Clostridiales bacterium 41_21_two_genomes]